MSRPKCPKQFLTPFGDRHSLYPLTLMRLHDYGVDHVLVAPRSHATEVKDLLERK